MFAVVEARVCILLACGFEQQKASGSWKPAIKDKNQLFILLYIRWITKSIPKRSFWHRGKASCAPESLSSFFFSLCPYATDKRRERLRKHKRESSARKASFSGFLSISKKSSFQRNESIRWEICTSEKTVKFFDGWAKLAANEAVREGCRSRFDYSKYSAILTTNHAKMAPSANPARTSVKKCLLSAIRLQPTNRDNETATTCSNGLSNLVSVLTAAWRYN